MSVSSARSKIFITNRALQFFQLRRSDMANRGLMTLLTELEEFQEDGLFYKYFAPSGAGDVPSLLSPGICQN